MQLKCGHSTLKQKAERVQRRATRWILQIKQGELSYKERLIHLDLLPLTYLVFLYKALYGYIDIDISFIKSVSHGRSRRSQSSDITYLETPLCKTATSHSSLFIIFFFDLLGGASYGTPRSRCTLPFGRFFFIFNYLVYSNINLHREFDQ